MKALVTGGAGFIGSHIADRLLRDGYSVTILDNLEPRVHRKGKPDWIPSEVEFIQGDVRDRDILKRALHGANVVFHEAAYQDYMPDFSKFLHVNSVSTALIHELVLADKEISPDNKVEKIVVASSQAVYGEGQYSCRNISCDRHNVIVQPESRSHEQLQRGQWEISCSSCGELLECLNLQEEYHNPYNAYAISKLAEEMAAVRLGKLHGIPTVALRYSIVQGPRQSLYNQYSGICRIFCLRLLNGLPPIVYEDGMQRRDYTHIDDVVEANMTVLRDDRADYQVFNVGSGREITVREYAEALKKKLRISIESEISGKYRVGDNRHSVSDIGRLMNLGWNPRKGLDEIIDDYISWVERQDKVGEYFREAEKAMSEQGVIKQAGKMTNRLN